MEYPAVDMPSEVTYVLITYVIVHVVVHMVLTIQRFYLERMAVGTPNKGETEFESFKKDCKICQR